MKKESVFLKGGSMATAARKNPKGCFEGLDDSSVVALYLEGDDRAFEELVERYRSRLLAFIRRTTGDAEKAEDLVQEAFIRVFRHIHHFDQAKKFSTWIYTIASNLAKNELRNRSHDPLMLFPIKDNRRESNSYPIQLVVHPTYDPDKLFRERRLLQMVDEAIAKMDEHHRVPFVLRDREGKTYEEIAEILGCPLGTLKSRLNRARNNFAHLIKPRLR